MADPEFVEKARPTGAGAATSPNAGTCAEGLSIKGTVAERQVSSVGAEFAARKSALTITPELCVQPESKVPGLGYTKSEEPPFQGKLKPRSSGGHTLRDAGSLSYSTE
jgi:hypothetical protein